VADERVLLITGASTGIGAETAKQAVAAGWKVVLAARSEDKLLQLAGELGGIPPWHDGPEDPPHAKR